MTLHTDLQSYANAIRHGGMASLSNVALALDELLAKHGPTELPDGCSHLWCLTHDMHRDDPSHTRHPGLGELRPASPKECGHTSPECPACGSAGAPVRTMHETGIALCSDDWHRVNDQCLSCKSIDKLRRLAVHADYASVPIPCYDPWHSTNGAWNQ